MNEVRDLIIGIDFGEKYSQICYYDRKTEEPVSLSIKVGSSDYEIPTCLCKRSEQGDYHVGVEAQFFARERDGVLLENLYEICGREEPVLLAGESKEPYELLAIYLKGIQKFLGVMEIVKNTKHLTIAMKELNPIQVRNWQRACESLGYHPQQYMLLDYEESFYYYVFTQKKEIWNRNAAWYRFDGNRVIYRSFKMDSSLKPIPVRLSEEVEVELPPEGPDRDDSFVDFIRATVKTDVYSSIHLNGNGFSQDWADASIRLLCFQKRKVFYGNNLYARGACGAGLERSEKKELKQYRFIGKSVVLKEIGMEMRIMGAPAYYALIAAGKNWYECKAECELILDDTKELIFTVVKEDGERCRVAMQLNGLPSRPNKTTRLQVSLCYQSNDECLITVKDLGFGDLYPSSGKIWKECTTWNVGEDE